ncbi:MAG: AraC family transcriptional regulator ligand-binding domain-containing protein [Halieaceae bacterium]
MSIKRTSRPGTWLTDGFRGMGVDINVLVSSLPKEMEALLERPDSVTAHDLNRVLLACEEQTGDKHFGLHLIEGIDLNAMGLYGYLLLNASTIGEFLSLAERYYAIFYRTASLEIDSLRHSLRIVYKSTELHALDTRHDDEWTLGALVNTIRSRIGTDWRPLKTTFQWEAPKDLSELQRFFGDNLFFNQPMNSFEVGLSLLAAPLNDSDVTLLKIIREQADEQLKEFSKSASVEAQLRLLIMKDLELGPPKAEKIAREMGMSLSTLKRVLTRQGLGFRAIRDGVIRELATRALIETEVSVGQLAMQMGYSEVSAFNHAFLRLVGESPSAYRRKYLLK